MVYFTTSSKILALALLSGSTLVAALPAASVATEPSGALDGTGASSATGGPSGTGFAPSGTEGALSGTGGVPSGTGIVPSGTGGGGASSTRSKTGPSGTGVPSGPGAPSSTIDACPGPSSTGTAGCKPITAEQVQTIPGWPEVKKSMEARFGAGKDYNLVANAPDFPDKVLQDCKGVATGYVWFNFMEVIEGHYKWAVKVEDVVPEEAKRKLKGGADGPPKSGGVSSGLSGPTGVPTGETSDVSGLPKPTGVPTGENTDDLPAPSGGPSSGLPSGPSSKTNAGAPSGTGTGANPTGEPTGTGTKAGSPSAPASIKKEDSY